MTYGIICLLTAAAAAAGTWLLCKHLLTRLGLRELGVKNTPSTIGVMHHDEKGYIPRCGGLLPSAAVLASAAVMLLLYALLCSIGNVSGVSRLSNLQRMYIWGGLLIAPLFGAAGFLEDYAVVFRRMRKGMPGWARLIVQAVIAAGYLAAIWLSGDRGAGITTIPFAGEVRMGFWYYPLSLLLILAVVKGAELAQEADGVMPTVGFFSFMPVIVAAGFLSSYNAGVSDAGILAVAGAGSCIAFLACNFVPATARTGVAGGAFMGALLCGAAFSARMPVLLLLCGAAYIAESVTALIGWITERVRGEAVCAPLHRMIGRRDKNDIQITVIFAAITALLGAAAAALAVLGKQ